MTSTLTNQQKKEWAKLLYMQERLTLQEIAAKVGASRVTVGKWAQQGQWEMLRAAATSTREEQVRNLYQQIAQINKAIGESNAKYATPAQADTIGKLSAAIAKLEADYGIADIIGVSKRFLSWLRTRNPQQAAEMADQFDLFIKESLSN